MWTAENNTNLNEDMIVPLVIAVYKQDKLTPFFLNFHPAEVPIVFLLLFFFFRVNLQLLKVNVINLGSKFQIFEDSIVSQFPKQTKAQRKPNQI